ncbi:hypothetical protein THAOC_31751, partial [Thalassiosira oceanica]
MDARGARESMDAAKQSVSTARKWAESSAASLERARKRLAEIRDEVDRCERQASDASNSLQEAQRYLKDLEKRYEVIDVDEETPQQRKKQRLSHDGETPIAPPALPEESADEGLVLRQSMSGLAAAAQAGGSDEPDDLGGAGNRRQQLMASGHERPKEDVCHVCFELIELPINKCSAATVQAAAAAPPPPLEAGQLVVLTGLSRGVMNGTVGEVLAALGGDRWEVRVAAAGPDGGGPRRSVSVRSRNLAPKPIEAGERVRLRSDEFNGMTGHVLVNSWDVAVAGRVKMSGVQTGREPERAFDARPDWYCRRTRWSGRGGMSTLVNGGAVAADGQQRQLR